MEGGKVVVRGCGGVGRGGGGGGGVRSRAGKCRRRTKRTSVGEAGKRLLHSTSVVRKKKFGLSGEGLKWGRVWARQRCRQKEEDLFGLSLGRRVIAIERA